MLNKEKVDAMIVGIESGMSYAAVGKALGVTHGVVKWYCDKAGVHANTSSYHQRAKLSESDIEQIVDLALKGTSVDKIAEQFKVTPNAIVHRLKRSNVGMLLYPLTPREEKIYHLLGRYSVQEISNTLNITTKEIKAFAFERGLSISTKQIQWTQLEEDQLTPYLTGGVIPESDRKRIAKLTGRTEAAVNVHFLKMKKAHAKASTVPVHTWTEDELALLQCVIDINRPLTDVEKDGLANKIGLSFDEIAKKTKEVSGGWWTPSGNSRWDEETLALIQPYVDSGIMPDNIDELAAAAGKSPNAIRTKIFKLRGVAA